MIRFSILLLYYILEINFSYASNIFRNHPKHCLNNAHNIIDQGAATTSRLNPSPPASAISNHLQNNMPQKPLNTRHAQTLKTDIHKNRNILLEEDHGPLFDQAGEFFKTIFNGPEYTIEERAYAGIMYRHYKIISIPTNYSHLIQLYEDFFNMLNPVKNPNHTLQNLMSTMAYFQKKDFSFYYLYVIKNDPSLADQNDLILKLTKINDHRLTNPIHQSKAKALDFIYKNIPTQKIEDLWIDIQNLSLLQKSSDEKFGIYYVYRKILLQNIEIGQKIDPDSKLGLIWKAVDNEMNKVKYKTKNIDRYMHVKDGLNDSKANFSFFRFSGIKEYLIKAYRAFPKINLKQLRNDQLILKIKILFSMKNLKDKPDDISAILIEKDLNAASLAQNTTRVNLSKKNATKNEKNNIRINYDIEIVKKIFNSPIQTDKDEYGYTNHTQIYIPGYRPDLDLHQLKDLYIQHTNLDSSSEILGAIEKYVSLEFRLRETLGLEQFFLKKITKFALASGAKKANITPFFQNIYLQNKCLVCSYVVAFLAGFHGDMNLVKKLLNKIREEDNYLISGNATQEEIEKIKGFKSLFETLHRTHTKETYPYVEVKDMTAREIIEKLASSPKGINKFLVVATARHAFTFGRVTTPLGKESFVYFDSTLGLIEFPTPQGLEKFFNKLILEPDTINLYKMFGDRDLFDLNKNAPPPSQQKIFEMRDYTFRKKILDQEKNPLEIIHEELLY